VILIKAVYSDLNPTIKVAYDVTNVNVVDTSSSPIYVNMSYDDSGANPYTSGLIKVAYNESTPSIKVAYEVTDITISGGDSSPVYVSLDYSASGAATNITSVGLTMPEAFNVANSPLTVSGTIAVTAAGTGAQYIKGDGTLGTFPTTINQALTLIREVYNSTGSTLTKGTVVYINGGQGNLPTVTKALAVGDTTSAQTFGVVQSDITNQNNGFVVVAGGINSLNTQAFAVGTALYLSPTTAGAYTSTKPYAPQHIVYIGVVVRSHPTMGVIEVKIQNGYELDELHNVAAQNPDDGMIISYVASTSLWTKTNTIDLGTW